MRKYLMVLGLCSALAACGGSTPGHPGQDYAHTATSPAAQTAAFAKAQAAWKQSATAAAASVDRYLLQAANDLKAAGGGSGFPAAVRELTDLASIPETGTTKAQQAQAMADVAALDRFFKTPGLVPSG